MDSRGALETTEAIVPANSWIGPRGFRRPPCKPTLPQIPRVAAIGHHIRGNEIRLWLRTGQDLAPHCDEERAHTDPARSHWTPMQRRIAPCGRGRRLANFRAESKCNPPILEPYRRVSPDRQVRESVIDYVGPGECGPCRLTTFADPQFAKAQPTSLLMRVCTEAAKLASRYAGLAPARSRDAWPAHFRIFLPAPLVQVPCMTLKELVKGKKVRFKLYRDSELWYATDDGFEFPDPIADTGTGIFKAEDNAIAFMRWIRKHLISPNAPSGTRSARRRLEIFLQTQSSEPATGAPGSRGFLGEHPLPTTCVSKSADLGGRNHGIRGRVALGSSAARAASPLIGCTGSRRAQPPCTLKGG
jgi:hypothetical protein